MKATNKEPSAPLQHTIDDSAMLLSTHRNTIHRLIAEGRLRSYLVGRRRYIRHSELLRFLDQAEAEKAAA